MHVDLIGLGAVVLLAGLVARLGRRSGLPSIPCYMVVGIAFGPGTPGPVLIEPLAIAAGLDARIGPFVALYVLILAVLSPLLAANSQHLARRMPDWLLRRGWRYVREETISTSCTHLDRIRITETEVDVCAECVERGDEWVELRLCTSCGAVGCCDDSPNKHATAHARQTGHPIIEPLSDGRWRYCYLDQVLVRAPIGRSEASA